MAHLPDYVKWRGDISFADSGFRIEDNLILSELAYVDYKMVLGDGVSGSLRQTVIDLDRTGYLRTTRAASTDEDLDFIRLCASSKRFGEVILRDFKDIYDSSDRQFAAVTYIINDLSVVAFRGTDSTIIGWKEDFMISYTNVPSQYLALDYAREQVKKAKGKVIILGHSKGGHLALYAAAHLDEKEQEKLLHVYVNDGPGFCNDVLDKSLIENIRRKLTKITPEYSIIGRLFENDIGENIIVRSSNNALLQHNMLSWLLDDGNGLLVCNDHAPESYLVTDNIDRFLDGMDLQARENFIDSLFDSMSATGATTIKDFAAQGPAVFEKLLFQMAGNDALNIKGKAKKVRKEDDENYSIFIRVWGLINRKEIIRIVISVLLAILCFAFPDFAMETVVFGTLVIFCIYEMVQTIKHLKSSEWDFKKERPRVTMCIVLMVLTVVVLVKNAALFVVSSTILGVTLLSLAYQNLINFRIYNDKMFERFRYSFEGIVTLFLGAYILLVPEIENRWYMISCGNLLLIDAIFVALKMIRDRKKKG